MKWGFCGRNESLRRSLRWSFIAEDGEQQSQSKRA